MKPSQVVLSILLVGLMSSAWFAGCAKEGALTTGSGGAIGFGGIVASGGVAGIGAGGAATGGAKLDAAPVTGGAAGLPVDAPVATGGAAGQPSTGGSMATGGRVGSGGVLGSGGTRVIPIDGGGGRTCGGFAGLGCGTAEFCDLASKCGQIADATGTCVPTGSDVACTMIYAPVCGCDGKTYGNDCARQVAAVLKASDGACATSTGGSPGTGGRTGTGGISGSGGKNTGGTGAGGRTGVGGSAGTSGTTNRDGGVGSTCGGIAGLGCGSGLFCDLASKCGQIMDATGTCVSTGPSIACPAIYQPVCGCDGKTYGNDCERGGAGVLKASDGACPSKDASPG